MSVLHKRLKDLQKHRQESSAVGQVDPVVKPVVAETTQKQEQKPAKKSIPAVLVFNMMAAVLLAFVLGVLYSKITLIKNSTLNLSQSIETQQNQIESLGQKLKDMDAATAKQSEQFNHQLEALHKDLSGQINGVNANLEGKMADLSQHVEGTIKQIDGRLSGLNAAVNDLTAKYTDTASKLQQLANEPIDGQ